MIVVGGVPGAGKTTLARRLADALHVPAIARDEIKEGMHVTARSEDPSEVRRFSAAAFETFWSTVTHLVDRGVSLVAEAALHREHAAADLERLAGRADVVLVWCEVELAVALARYRARAPERHPAHADEVFAERMSHPAFDSSTYDPPPGPWPVIVVDTADHDPPLPLAELGASLEQLVAAG